MDWELAIRKNRAALRDIVAGLMALVAPGTARLSAPAYRTALAILRPAESALRRLIVIAAAVLQSQLGAKKAASTGRALPDFAGFNAGEALRPFPLIDARKSFGPEAEWPGLAAGMPRISVPGVLDPEFAARPPSEFDATGIVRRIAVLDRALKTLPRQAKRLIRLMERRGKAKPGPGRTGPVRPGEPPGHRKRHRHPVDEILRECHLLARDCAFRPP